MSESDVDLNNLDFDYVEEEIDEQASIYDAAAPPPERGADGKPILYTAKIKLVPNGAKKPVRTDLFGQNCVGAFVVDGIGHLQVTVEYVLQLGANGGPSCRAWESTMKRRGAKTTPVDSLLLATTGATGARKSNQQKMVELYKKLETEPQVGVQIQWILVEKDGHLDSRSGKKVYDTFLYGENKFPQSNVPGQHRVLESFTVDGQDVAAVTKFRIAKMFPLSGGAPGGGDGVPF